MPSTRNRVPANTRDDINGRIKRAIERRVNYYERHPAESPERLRELDENGISNARSRRTPRRWHLPASPLASHAARNG